MRYIEYAGMSYEQASREADRLIKAAAKSGSWFELIDRLAALKEIMQAQQGPQASGADLKKERRQRAHQAMCEIASERVERAKARCAELDNWIPAASPPRRPAGNWPEDISPPSEWPMPQPPRNLSVSGPWMLFTAAVYLAAAIVGAWFLLSF